MDFSARIETDVEVDGTPRTSPRFPILVRERKLRACQERMGRDTCTGCTMETHCQLRSDHLHDVRVLLPDIEAAEKKAGLKAADANVWLKML